VKTPDFDKIVRKKPDGSYVMKGGRTVPTCFATDFFIAEADEWRAEAWKMIKARPDIEFLILTKRIDRFPLVLPEDWGDGYDNVRIGCTVERQEYVDYRLPLFLSYPIKRRFIACSPLLERIDLRPWLDGVELVSVAGESGREARECDYEWVLDLREQCEAAGKMFWFKGTGSFFRKDGEVVKVNPFMQGRMAKELGINITNGKRFY